MSNTSAAHPPERLRTAPSERFAGSTHLFDLRSAIAKLRAEPHPARDGHRQVTIFQQTPITHVLFSFEPGGMLNKHSTSGLVTIQALEGRLRVSASAEEHLLHPGELLILRPNVPHDVHCDELSAMLLTVHLGMDTARQ